MIWDSEVELQKPGTFHITCTFFLLIISYWAIWDFAHVQNIPARPACTCACAGWSSRSILHSLVIVCMKYTCLMWNIHVLSSHLQTLASAWQIPISLQISFLKVTQMYTWVKYHIYMYRCQVLLMDDQFISNDLIICPFFSCYKFKIVRILVQVQSTRTV